MSPNKFSNLFSFFRVFQFMTSTSNNNSDQNTIELKSLIQLLKILPNKLTETTPKSLVQEISKVKNIHGMVGKRGFVSCKTFKPLN